MTCYSPMERYQTYEGGEWIFKLRKHEIKARKPGDRVLGNVPCRNCIGCRLDYSRQWAVRGSHELQTHNGIGSFITLTYAPEKRPPGGKLVKSDLQKFIKRVRKKFPDINMSYFACGEYGAQKEDGSFGHPHFHIIIFGLDFKDKYPFGGNKHGNIYYRSPQLEKLWKLGMSTIGEVNFATIAYTARYVMKKVNGSLKEDHYQTVNKETGEIVIMPEEFVTMSLKPALGKRWFQEFKSDVFPSDEVIIEGNKYKVPRYYNELYEKENPEAYLKVKKARLKKINERPDDDKTYGRLIQKEAVAKAALIQKMRKLD